MKKQSIAKQIGISEFPLQIFDKQGYITYSEDMRGNWFRQIYDEHGRVVHFKNSHGIEWCCAYNMEGDYLFFRTINVVVNGVKVKLTKDE